MKINSKLFEKTQGIVKHPLFSGSMIMFVGSMGANAINYIYHVIMGRMLGPASYGVLASLYSILYLTSIVPISASVGIVKFISSSKSEEEKASVYKSINKFVNIFALFFAAAILIVSPSIAKFLNIKELLNVILVVPVIYLSLITLVNQATSQGNLNFLGVVVPNITSAFVKFLLGIILVLMGFSVSGAITGVALSALVSYIISVRFIKKIRETVVKNIFAIRSFYKYSLPVLIQALSFTSLFTVDVLLVKHFFPPFEAGLYAAISTLGKIIYFAAQPISQVMFPIVSARKSKGHSFTKVFYISFLGTLLISSLVVVFYFLFPRFTIGMLYGRAYLSAVRELVWMGAFITIYTSSYFLINFLLSIGKTNVVYLPLIAATLQIVGIWKFHNSIFQVILISLILVSLLFVSTIFYMIYNQFRKNYASK